MDIDKNIIGKPPNVATVINEQLIEKAKSYKQENKQAPLIIDCNSQDLRLMAKLVRDYDYKEISRMLREAADTIESLSDKLQGVMGTRYCELFGTPERVARTLDVLNKCSCDEDYICDDCAFHGNCDLRYGDYTALLEWLRGDAE